MIKLGIQRIDDCVCTCHVLDFCSKHGNQNYIFLCASFLAPLLPHRGCSPQTEEPWEEALQPAQEESALLHHPRNCPHPAHWSPPWKGETICRLCLDDDVKELRKVSARGNAISGGLEWLLSGFKTRNLC